MPRQVFVEISKRRPHNRIEVSFRFDRAMIERVKIIPGRRWSDTSKIWTVPLDLDTCRLLRQQFGDELVIGSDLKAWARREVKHVDALTDLALGDSADLVRLPEVLPDLMEALHIGPRAKGMSPKERRAYIQAHPRPSFQCADVAFMAKSEAPLNANQPGMGKTIETIASVFEAGMEDGPQIVLAPKSSLETVWEDELNRWQPLPVLVALGTADERGAVAEQALELYEAKEPFWFVTNPGMLTYRSDWLPCEAHEEGSYAKERRRCPYCTEEEFFAYPELLKIRWKTMIIDECHRAAIGSPNTKTYRAMTELSTEKSVVLSGTPFGGKPVKLFYLLQWQRPDVFTSKWRWADRWLEVEENDYGKKIGGIRPDMEEQFYESLAPYVIRRTKREEAPDLPPKQYIELLVPMEGKQLKQYNEMDEESEVKINNEHLSVQGVLDEYTRLKQFANSYCTIVNGKVMPTEDSCKLPPLMDKLEELGIMDEEGTAQVIIFSQFRAMVDMVHGYLLKKKINAEKITGEVSTKERTRIQREFQGDHPLRVLVMSTKAGGVSITLDEADTVFILDETWNPDDQEQAEDRVDRMSKVHQVTIYQIKAKDTVEEYIAATTAAKSKINRDVLDGYRRARKAKRGLEAFDVA